MQKTCRLPLSTPAQVGGLSAACRYQRPVDIMDDAVTGQRMVQYAVVSQAVIQLGSGKRIEHTLRDNDVQISIDRSRQREL